jgi:hypothetical protein
MAVRLEFDRGTLLVKGDARLADLPGVRFDPRVECLRAPARFHACILASLAARGVHVEDRALAPVLPRGAALARVVRLESGSHHDPDPVPGVEAVAGEETLEANPFRISVEPARASREPGRVRAGAHEVPGGAVGLDVQELHPQLELLGVRGEVELDRARTHHLPRGGERVGLEHRRLRRAAGRLGPPEVPVVVGAAGAPVRVEERAGLVPDSLGAAVGLEPV